METVPQILEQCKSVAIVGYSAKPGRASHWISNYLEEQGWRVFRVNPVLESSLNCPIFKSLAAVPESIDIVDVFRAPEHLPAIVELAIQIGARTVWMQPGAENPAAALKAQQAGLNAVLDLCIYKAHKSHFGIQHSHE